MSRRNGITINEIGRDAKMTAFGMKWGYKAQLDKLEASREMTAPRFAATVQNPRRVPASSARRRRAGRSRGGPQRGSRVYDREATDAKKSGSAPQRQGRGCWPAGTPDPQGRRWRAGAGLRRRADPRFVAALRPAVRAARHPGGADGGGGRVPVGRFVPTTSSRTATPTSTPTGHYAPTGAPATRPGRRSTATRSAAPLVQVRSLEGHGELERFMTEHDVRRPVPGS